MKVVLHICCGICAAGAAEQLQKEGHDILGFFYNPNTYPADEFEKRLEVARRVSRELGFPLEAPPYVPAEWYDVAGEMADEPEDGARCNACYRLRLSRTRRFMEEGGWDALSTTLTIGPRKRASIINAIGAEIAGDRFLARDFKKKDGFKRANELASKWGLYRQHYCGCEFSFR
jgi:predicted adenine nucleotide alpha hydrolase (AANH) superfamily ATPase